MKVLCEIGDPVRYCDRCRCRVRGRRLGQFGHRRSGQTADRRRAVGRSSIFPGSSSRSSREHGATVQGNVGRIAPLIRFPERRDSQKTWNWGIPISSVQRCVVQGQLIVQATLLGGVRKPRAFGGPGDGFIIAGLVLSVVKVGKKGQVILPRPLKERWGVKEGSELLIAVEGDQAIVRPVRRTRLKDDAGCLGRPDGDETEFAVVDPDLISRYYSKKYGG